MFWAISASLTMVVAVADIAVNASSGGPLAAYDGSSSVLVWATGFGNLVVIAGLLLIGHRWSGRPLGELIPLRRFNPILLLVLLPLGLGISVVLSEADNLLQLFLPSPQWLREMMADLAGHGVASFFALVIVAPLSEEAFFRGFVINGYLKRYGVTKAIVLQALMFAVFHLNPYQMLGAFGIGLVLGVLRWRTGSLWPCIWFHALANGIVFLCLALQLEIPGYSVYVEGGFQPWWFDLVGLICAAVGLTSLLAVLRSSTSDSSPV